MSRSINQDNSEAQLRERELAQMARDVIERERHQADPDTISVYEAGSVKFLESIVRLPHWEDPGVPVSGDKTATFFVRSQLGIA